MRHYRVYLIGGPGNGREAVISEHLLTGFRWPVWWDDSMPPQQAEYRTGLLELQEVEKGRAQEPIPMYYHGRSG